MNLKKQIQLSIIIVNFKVKDLVLQCLESIKKETSFPHEIIVVDNASYDGSVAAIQERFPQVRIIQNTINSGFARANNQGINIAKGSYILLLNPDTEIRDHAIDKAVAFMQQHQEIGALTVKLMKPNGQLDLTCRGELTPKRAFTVAFLKATGLQRFFPRNKSLVSYYLLDLNHHSPQSVDKIAGAFFLTRADVLNNVGLLDERYFMYGEDVDLCYRLKRKGYKVVYYPHTSVIHYGGESSKKMSYPMIKEFYRSMQLYHNKFYRTNMLGYATRSAVIHFLMFVALAGNVLRKEKRV
ncbi:glycosyltransferase family 2 protein [Candidatus Woesearchaeota archaeon]|nr:glycosyltransferase family 2 protein [Candidatus Woesearchaeota archaeon]